MSAIILDVSENTTPNYAVTVQNNEVDIDLTNVISVELIIINGKTGDVTNTGHQSCTITDADDGQVVYSPVSTDFPSAGRYRGEVKISFTGGAIERLNETIDFAIRENFNQ